MYQKERLDTILALLQKQHYASVKDLTELLHYSTATVNRDLNLLEAQKLVKRSYGGVELVESKGVPLPFRYHKMHAEKNKIARLAASLVRNGERIFMDASTTTQAMAHFLYDKHDLTVMTNNMALAIQVSEMGHKAICLGGTVCETPCMLVGDETVEQAMRLRADKMFFSVGYVSGNGRRIASGIYGMMHRAMAENSDEVYLLVDRDKVDSPFVPQCYLFDFGHLTAVISDYEFDSETQARYDGVKFLRP